MWNCRIESCMRISLSEAFLETWDEVQRDRETVSGVISGIKVSAMGSIEYVGHMGRI